MMHALLKKRTRGNGLVPRRTVSSSKASSTDREDCNARKEIEGKASRREKAWAERSRREERNPGK